MDGLLTFNHLSQSGNQIITSWLVQSASRRTRHTIALCTPGYCRAGRRARFHSPGLAPESWVQGLAWGSNR